MRLVTLDSREVGGRPGIWMPTGEILDLAASPTGLTASQWRPQSVVSVLAEGDEGAARVARLVAECLAASDAERRAWRQNGRLLPATGTRLMPPIRRPGLLLMVTDPGTGAAYVKNPNAAAGPDAIVTVPEGAGGQLFLRAMLGLVVGRPLFRATSEQAAKAIAAVTLVADLGTARSGGAAGNDGGDARQFPGACVIGPALVTRDELPLAGSWGLTVAVNGRPVGAGQLPLDVARAPGLLAGLSARFGFRPGDIVGLPSGTWECELPAGAEVRLGLGGQLELGFSTRT